MIILKILFENTTQYTKSVYDEFLSFHNKKYHFSYTFYTVVVVAFLLLCLILQVKNKHYSLVFLFCISITIFILWRFFRPITDVCTEYKSEKIQKEKNFTFKFYHNFFTVEDEKEFSTIKYLKLYRVFETKNFFYLYIDKKHSFLIDKSKFKKENSDEFSHFIKKKCWLKLSIPI